MQEREADGSFNHPVDVESARGIEPSSASQGTSACVADLSVRHPCGYGAEGNEAYTMLARRGIKPMIISNLNGALAPFENGSSDRSFLPESCVESFKRLHIFMEYKKSSPQRSTMVMMKLSKLFMFLMPLFISNPAVSQNLGVYHMNPSDQIYIDGILEEPAWAKADSITDLRMVEPNENENSTMRTTLKVLTDQKQLLIGIFCYDPEPGKIVSISKSRDSDFRREDRIKIVFDTFRDLRSGYIFAVNPSGTRYDALVSDFGEGENSDWDAAWTAKTRIHLTGWSVEIAVPIQSLSFPRNRAEWGFNFERRIQRSLEKDRWCGAKRDYKISHVIHAGTLSNLPRFEYGLGMLSTLSGVGSLTNFQEQESERDVKYSLDFSKKITANVSAQLTVRTDFAETEVDTRQTNLTRFPLFFPEKRGFFLEGADIFNFGIGLNSDVIPFFSRRIGLHNEEKVPIQWGVKTNGKVSDVNFGALTARTGSVENLVPSALLGAFRIKHNILNESSLGMI